MSTLVGKNVELELIGDILTIKVDISKEFGQSASKKSTILASTGGFAQFGDGIAVGLNVVKKA